MARYASTISFGGVNLKVTDISPRRRQKSVKQVIGKDLVQVDVLGRDAQQWELRISGKVVGTTLNDVATNRASIENLDDVAPHAYSDGIHNGTYIMVPNTLQFQDTSSDVNSSFTYSFRIVEE